MRDEFYGPAGHSPVAEIVMALFFRSELRQARDWLTWFKTPMWPTEEELQSAKDKVDAMSDKEVLSIWHKALEHLPA